MVPTVDAVTTSEVGCYNFISHSPCLWRRSARGTVAQCSTTPGLQGWHTYKWMNDSNCLLACTLMHYLMFLVVITVKKDTSFWKDVSVVMVWGWHNLLYVSGIVTSVPSRLPDPSSSRVWPWTRVGRLCVPGQWTRLRCLCGPCRQADCWRWEVNQGDVWWNGSVGFLRGSVGNNVKNVL